MVRSVKPRGEIVTLKGKIRQVTDEAAALAARLRFKRGNRAFKSAAYGVRPPVHGTASTGKGAVGCSRKVGHELARLEERRNNLQKEYDEIISRLWEEYELTRREAEETFEKLAEHTGGAEKAHRT